ncbi:PREDICTED: uncharacterized protein LOC106110868 [Papilio polytes]|uniref:uncharacterized protein LOC106110868 n=1 Tax=Papilio polytes TaxID=76194 RepID=UPI00067600D2|nr:PREDICTED: uncharacterized protein LOC106110868 [Papilio polytes]
MRARGAPGALHALAVLACALLCRGKILRNNALMNQMMSQFQRDNSNNLSLEPVVVQASQVVQAVPGGDGGAGGARVLALMQSVLCKNFPSIPCRLITQDRTLSRLIEKSIQQINYKKLSLEKTTQADNRRTEYPLINSEDLSNFLQVQNTGYFDNGPVKRRRKKQKLKTERVNWSKEKGKKSSKQNKRTSVFGRKKLRKFYPHKVKYKDKTHSAQLEFRGEYSGERGGERGARGERGSLSLELPAGALAPAQQHYAYKREPAAPAVWRIDYAKHGGPSLNLLGSLTKTQGGGGGGGAGGGDEQGRKDVLHPDVYIKKNFIRKNSELVD